MENRDRDRVSQRSSSTEAGERNRNVERERGRRENSGTSAEFGQNIGRSENLEGGEMRNRNSQDSSDLKKSNTMENESSRRSGSESGYGSSSRRSGSLGESDSNTSRRSGSLDESDSSVSRNDKSSGRSGSIGSSGRSGSSEGRH